MSYKFSRCESQGQLRKIPVNTGYVKKEIIEAKRDLDSARKLLGSSEIKWAIVSSYYSMFHACRSLLYYAGYEEKSHECVIIAIDELYVKKSLLSPDIIKNIQDAKTARETADYGLTYGEESAKKVVAHAETGVRAHYTIPDQSGSENKSGLMEKPPGPEVTFGNLRYDCRISDFNSSAKAV